MQSFKHEGHPIFSAWDLYRKVVDHDYMEHTSITGEVANALHRVPHACSILDLGCGDAEVVTRLTKKHRIGRYFGVDQSDAALLHARERLDGSVDHLCLANADFLDFLGSVSLRFDVILCGYALHHLTLEQKRDFFRMARRRLHKGGMLIAYDVFRRPGESRDVFLDGYIRWVESEWTAFDDNEHASIAEHMRDADYPEEVETFHRLASQAGLHADHEFAWCGAAPYHQMHCVSH